MPISGGTAPPSPPTSVEVVHGNLAAATGIILAAGSKLLASYATGAFHALAPQIYRGGTDWEAIYDVAVAAYDGCGDGLYTLLPGLPISDGANMRLFNPGGGVSVAVHYVVEVYP